MDCFGMMIQGGGDFGSVYMLVVLYRVLSRVVSVNPDLFYSTLFYNVLYHLKESMGKLRPIRDALTTLPGER